MCMSLVLSVSGGFGREPHGWPCIIWPRQTLPFFWSVETLDAALRLEKTGDFCGNTVIIFLNIMRWAYVVVITSWPWPTASVEMRPFLKRRHLLGSFNLNHGPYV